MTMPVLRRKASRRAPPGRDALPALSGPAQHRRNDGFTLVELLVAMGLFGIFSAMTATSVVIMNDSAVSFNRLGSAAETSQYAFSAVVGTLQDVVSASTLQSFDTKYSASLDHSNCERGGIPITDLSSAGTGEIEFCSYGVTGTASAKPDLYSLDVCSNGATTAPGSLTLTDKTTGHTVVSIGNVVCSSAPASPPASPPLRSGTLACPNQAEPESYVAFYTAQSCSFTVPISGVTSIFLSVTVSANPHGAIGGGGSAPPTTISKVVNLPNLSGAL